MGMLRLLLALSVVFAHSPWHDHIVFVDGRSAVQMFYMISGFLMSHILVTTDKYPIVSRFYMSRWLRIYPLYFVVALLTLVFALLHHHAFFRLYRDLPLSADLLLAVSNLLILGQDWVMFSGIHDGHLAFVTDFYQSDILLFRGLLLPQAWTLGLELTFYLIAPYILRNRKAIWGCLAASIAVRIVLFALGLGEQDPWTYRFFPAELAFFLLGALSNQILLPWWRQFIARPALSHIPATAAYALAAFVMIFFLIPISEWIKIPFLFAVFLSLLPLAFIYQDSSAFDRAIGELSYPVYIGHLLIIDICASHIGAWTAKDPLAVSLVNAAVAIAFAFVLNKGVSQKIETFRSKLAAGRGAISSGFSPVLQAREAQ